MKLYNNSQKTPQSESLHKVKRNCKTPRQKMKVYTANITCRRLAVAASDMAGKNTPKQFYEITEKVSTHKILKQAVDIHKGN